MPRTEDVKNSIWDELDGLSNDALMLYLWSWTNPKCGMAGIYKVPRRKVLEGRLDDDALDAALAELAEADLLLYEAEVLWCKARVKRLRTKTAQIARSIANDFAEVPAASSLGAAFIEEYGRTPWLADALATPIRLQDVPSPHVPKKVRAEVYERDGFRCVDCGAEDGLSLDHVLARSAGGEATVENLVVRCIPCNSRKGVNPQRTSNESHSQAKNRGSKGGRRGLQGLGPGQGQGQGSTSLDPVLRSLGEVSEIRGLGFPDTAQVAKAIEDHPGVDPVVAARDFRYWACDGAGKTARFDLLDGFRRQLRFSTARRTGGEDKAAAVDAKVARLRAEAAA